MNKADLSLEQLILLQSEMRNAEKSLALAYFMLIGGHLGLHRFYLRRFASGAIQLVLFLLAVVAYYGSAVLYGFRDDVWTIEATAALIVSVASGAALFVWVIVDMCLLPGMVKAWNADKEKEIMQALTRLK
jgi:hypothetical protein